MKPIIIFGTIGFFLLVTIIVLLTVPYVKRTYDDTPEYAENYFETKYPIYWVRKCYSVHSGLEIHKPKEDIHEVILLNSASKIILCLFDLIINAKKSIILSTYRWRVEAHKITKRPNGQIIAIGYALTKLSARCKEEKKNVKFSILCNQMLLGNESNGWVEKQLISTLSCWKKIGFEPVESEHDYGVYVDFRTWPHMTLGNIHSKFIVIDNEKAAVYSLNIEGYSHGEEGTWREIGVKFISPHHAFIMTDYFHDLFDMHGHRFNIWKLLASVEKDDSLDVSFVFPSSISTKHISISGLILANIPRPFAINRKNPIINALVPLLRSATKNIYITTPNLNDVAILNILYHKITQGLDVKIIINKNFNTDVPAIQEALLGWSTNEQQLSKWLENGLSKHIRWNGKDNQMIQGKVDDQLHGKTYLVDDALMIGSFNADVYSTVSSAELVLLMNSKPLVEEFLTTWFDPLWIQAIPI